MADFSLFWKGHSTDPWSLHMFMDQIRTAADLGRGVATGPQAVFCSGGPSVEVTPLILDRTSNN